MKMFCSLSFVVVGLASLPSGALASFLKGSSPDRPNVLSIEDLVEVFKKTVGGSKVWGELAKKFLDSPESAPAPPIPVGQPNEPTSFVSFLNQLARDVNDGSGPEVAFGSVNVPTFAAEFAVPKSSAEQTEIIFRVGDRKSGDDRDAIRLKLLHLVRGSPPVSIGSSLAYKTSNYGLSIWGSTWGSTEDGIGHKEWIYLPVDAERSLDEVVVGLYAIEGGRFSKKEKCSDRKDVTLKSCLVIVSEFDNVTWLEVEAPVAYAQDGTEVSITLEIREGGKQLAVVLPKPTKQAMLIDPVWTQSNDMILGRRLHTATRLLDGRVLVAGGIDESNQPTDTVELYDPVSGTWETRAEMPEGTRSSAQVLLDDGRVLITHGAPNNAFAYLYNVTSDMWAKADPPRSEIGGPNTRLGSRIVKLPNGQVLLTGNFCCPGYEAHLYDPSEDKFYPVERMMKKRMAHSLTVLQDGSVLAAGGGTLNPSSLISNTAERFVPNMTSPTPYRDGTWVPVSDMTAGHFDHEAALIETGNDAGKVLVCAGADGATYPGYYVFTSVCDLYDPSSQIFTRVGNIPHIRQRGGTGNGGDFFATVKAGPSIGTVVAAGGWPSTYATNIYDPISMAWFTKCNLNEPRLRHQTVGLLDGSVAIFGGQLSPNSQAKRSVERLFLENDDDDCDGIRNEVDICPTGGCGVISGRVYHAKNETCDETDFGTANVMVRSENFATLDVRYAFSDGNGYYAFDLPPGFWEISLVDSSTIEEITDDDTCSPISRKVDVNAFSGRSDVDFPLKMNCQGVMTVEASGLNGTECNGQPYPTPCPGFGFQLCFVITNQGSGWNNVDLTFAVPQGMIFTGLGDNLCGFTIVSNFMSVITVNLQPMGMGGSGNAMGNGEQCRVCFDMDVVSIPAAGWTASGTFAGTTGSNPQAVPCAVGNATFVETDECGCDPNNKTVYPVGCDESGTYPGGPLAYSVRFQNKGLGPAYDVAILDEIDTDLDIQSIQLKSMSHSATDIQIDSSRVLYVRFDNIALPAAKDNYLESQGSIHFDIEPLPDRTQFTNKAEIYFDMNEVVITNEVVNTIGTCGAGPSQSGLGDGTNPGQGHGMDNSPNQGGGNPNNSPNP